MIREMSRALPWEARVWAKVRRVKALATLVGWRGSSRQSQQ